MVITSRIETLRQALAAAGLPELDDMTLARLARAADSDRETPERLKAILVALGVSKLDAAALDEIADLALRADSAE